MKLLNGQRKIRNLIFKDLLILVLFAFFMLTVKAQAGMKTPPPEKINTIILGDRVVDIAYNLGVLPVAMSVRGGMWDMAKKLKTTSHILGCPHCLSLKGTVLPEAVKKFAVTHVLIEKSMPYCLYMPNINPINLASQLDGMNVKIQYIDFTDGIESAVKQTAKFLDRETQAQAVIKKYKKDLAAVTAVLPVADSGKKVVIFNGTYQPSTGKSMLRVEAPDGYADRFLLAPLGYSNAGESFNTKNTEPSKGHYSVRKNKNGMVLDPLFKADPDVIIIVGDVFAVQKSFTKFAKTHPKFAQLKAIKNMAVYALPSYIDSSVLEYPGILKKWSVALTDK